MDTAKMSAGRHSKDLRTDRTATPEKTQPWTQQGMAQRTEWIFERIRRGVFRFFDADGRWRETGTVRRDPRVYIQTALPLLQGGDADRVLARKLLADEIVAERIDNNCSFCSEYMLAVIYGMGEAMPGDLMAVLRKALSKGLLAYARKDLQHHGYNDNHVALATATLVLGGQLVGNREAIEEGRANLMNFRDTFLRRGFMHETNDCYLPHTLYATAVVGEFAEDDEIRQLARDCEARIWVDWIGHYHPNLARKPGPSARDYTMGRLNPLATNVALWCILGDDVASPLFPPDDVFAIDWPDERFFAFHQAGDMFWNMGFLSRICAHGYHVPADIAPLICRRTYPHSIKGTHEVGHYAETVRRVVRQADGVRLEETEDMVIPGVAPFSAREIYTYQYQEADWAMGAASQRMIGNCPNNNWGINYRKRPLARSSDQGAIYCSFTINGKRITDDQQFQMMADDPTAVNKESMDAWFDNGRYAAMQHEGTAIVLYRPRVHEKHCIISLSTSIVFPLCFNNSIDHVWLGDTELIDFQGGSQDVRNIFVQDGPMFIGIRPLLSRPQGCAMRIKARREAYWGIIDLYAYDGPEIALSEMDLCRIGGGFICEVATRKEFETIDAFRSWFEAAEALDDQFFWMRQVRYRRKGLSLGIRWDVWSDNIMYRMLNGREMLTPRFECTGVDAAKLPWLEGDVSGLDHFDWAVRQARRSLDAKCKEPGRITDSLPAL